MTDTLAIGKKGEQAVEKFLRKQKFRILERNWRAGRYEIDLVVQKGDTLHFVEVKSRKAGSLTTPEEAITQAKFDALCMAARAYLAAHPWDGEVQFDLAAVEIDGNLHEVRYIPNAMTPRW